MIIQCFWWLSKLVSPFHPTNPLIYNETIWTLCHQCNIVLIFSTSAINSGRCTANALQCCHVADFKTGGTTSATKNSWFIKAWSFVARVADTLRNPCIRKQLDEYLYENSLSRKHHGIFLKRGRVWSKTWPRFKKRRSSFSNITSAKISLDFYANAHPGTRSNIKQTLKEEWFLLSALHFITFSIPQSLLLLVPHCVVQFASPHSLQVRGKHDR